jgi:SulP family sulfate permease
VNAGRASFRHHIARIFTGNLRPGTLLPVTLLPGARDYRDIPRTWRGDLVAGVTVGIVALPLALAFGVSSGAGAEAGLITASVAGLVAAIFGGSNVQVSGPTGAMVVVLGPIVASYGLSAVPVVTVLAGALVILAGLFKLGRAVTFIPWPVIEGFTLGIAVIIFLQQVPSAVGVGPGAGTGGHSTNAAVAAAEALAHVDWTTSAFHSLGPVAIVLAVVSIMWVTPRIHRSLPGSILAIVVVTVVAAIADLPVARIGALPASLPTPSIPVLDGTTPAALMGPALTIAALAAIESLQSARVATSLANTGPYDADRELVGQGLASVASGFFGGMPATGAIARTAVNVRAGGRTRLAAITHAVVLLGVVYLATGPVSQIPLAALAGVLMFTAVKMVSSATVKGVLRSTRSDALVFVITAIITVSFDLILAVEIGIAVAAFFALRALAKSGGVHREALPLPAEDGDDRIALFRLDGAIFFGTAERILQASTNSSATGAVSVVIIRMSQIGVLDATGARVLADIVRTLETRGITVLIKGVQERHLQLVTRVGVVRTLRTDHHLFDDLSSAVDHARSHVHRAAAESSTSTSTESL